MIFRKKLLHSLGCPMSFHCLFPLWNRTFKEVFENAKQKNGKAHALKKTNGYGIGICAAVFFFSFFLGIGQSVPKKLDSLYGALSPDKVDTSYVNTLNAIGFELRYDSIDTALKMVKKTERLSKDLNYDPGLMQSYYNAGILFKNLHKNDSALFYNAKARDLAIKLKDSKKVAATHFAAGRIHNLMGNYELAINAYQKSLKIEEERNDTIATIITTNSIGSLYNQLEEYDLALQYLNKSRNMAERAGHKNYLAMSLSNIGGVYFKKGDHDNALDLYQKSLQIAEEMGLTPGITINSIKIGETYLEQKKYTLAAKAFNRSLDISRKARDNRGLIKNLSNLAKIDLEQNRPYKALEKAKEAYAISDRIKSKINLKSTALLISEIYEKLNDPAQGLAYYKRHVAFKDTLFNLDKSEQIANLETKYQTEQKQQRIHNLEKENEIVSLTNSNQRTQIYFFITALALGTFALVQTYRKSRSVKKANTLLTQQKEVIEEQNTEISQALSEKEMLLQEINHRAKNNLSTIENLLRAQANLIKDNKAKALIEESRNRIHSISLLHQNLFESDIPDAVNIKHYFDSMFTNYMEALKDIKVHKNIEEGIVVDSTKAVALGLITNELITNSIKYAFAKNSSGELSISFQRKKDNLLLEVSDNGNGINETQEQDAKARQNSSYFGLELVKGLTRQLHGSINFIKQQGFMVSIEIPA